MMLRLLSYVLSAIRFFADHYCALYAKVFWPDQKGKVPSVDDKVLLLSATELANRIRKGELKSESVVKAYIKRIKQVNPLINAVIDERYEEATKEARAIDKRVAAELSGQKPEGDVSINDQLLLGVPFTVKDSVNVKGLKNTAGIPALKDTVAPSDAALVQNMRTAGGIPLVLTNVPCALMWWTTENSTFGRTNNPYDLSRIAGGSSGGEAAALASAASVIGVGSDIGGSIRIPAHCCGIYGHKTTSGIICDDGKFPPPEETKARYFCMGPMTRYAVDLLPTLKAMAGDDISKLPLIDETVNFSKIKVYYMLDDLDPLKTRTVERTRNVILKLADHLNKTYNAEVKPVTFREFAKTNMIFLSCLRDTKSSTFGHLLRGLVEESPKVNIIAELFKSFLNKSIFTKHALIFGVLFDYIVPGKESSFVQNNVKARDDLIAEFTKLLGNDGVFILPTLPEAAAKHGTTVLKSPNVNYCSILNVLGLPATHCPIGLDDNGVPLGIQIAATPFNDHLTLAVAQEVDKLFGGWVAPFAT
ncbi:Fatty-acid amide hydrolase 2 [Halotydeus destructor]|nr:Fatty-acid amide hydrolase 2 [Halotydeus destructor]